MQFISGPSDPPGPARVAAPALWLSLELRDSTTNDNTTFGRATLLRNHRRLALAPRADPPGDAGLGWVGPPVCAHNYCSTTVAAQNDSNLTLRFL